MDISFIIPLYKGRKYIDSIIKMMQRVQKKYKNPIEVVFINDSPEEEITVNDYYTEDRNIQIIQFTNRYNMGIHKSRIIGFEKSRGKYVVFMDQDDEISKNYIIQQMASIGEADAVVCNGKHFNKVIYPDVDKQKRVANWESYYYENPIVSPGQVMIKRDAVPNTWITSALSINGADDNFLWILMLYEGKHFAICNRILYLHRVTGDNSSSDSHKMELSVCEMIDMLVKMKIWNPADVERRKRNMIALEGINKDYKRSVNYSMINEWIYIKQRGISIEKFFLKRGITTIAIYGCGILGRFLEGELKKTRVKVAYYIDKRGCGATNLPVFDLDNCIYATEMIVISLPYGYNQIRNDLLEIGINSEVVSIVEILAGLDTQLE